MKNQINMAVQILPWSASTHPYGIVDEAVEIIKKSGVRYKVCPFETVMEGEYELLMKIVAEIHEACYKAGADNMLCYLKIQSNKEGMVTIEDKMKKYE